MAVNSFDVVFGILVLLLAWRGFSRGAISQLAAVLGIIIGWIVAMRGSDALAQIIPIAEPARHYIAMTVLFVLALVAVRVAGWFAQTIFRLVLLGWLDHLAGTALGVVKAVLIGIIITLVAILGSDATAHWVGKSASGTFCVAAILKTEQLIPDNVGTKFHEQIAEFQNKVTKLEAAGELKTLPTLMKGDVTAWGDQIAAAAKNVANGLEKDVSNWGQNAVPSVQTPQTQQSGNAWGDQIAAAAKNVADGLEKDVANWGQNAVPSLQTPQTQPSGNAWGDQIAAAAKDVANGLEKDVANWGQNAVSSLQPVANAIPSSVVAVPAKVAATVPAITSASTPVSTPNTQSAVRVFSTEVSSNAALQKPPTSPAVFDPAAWAKALRE